MGKPRGSMPVSMHEVPGADITISDVRVDDRFEEVSLSNRGQLDQPLTGWALASLHGLDVFRFPDGTVLEAGQEFRILSGEGAQATSQHDLVWKRQDIWSNRSDMALLFDSLGHEVSRFTYPRPNVRDDRVPKLKILVQDRDGYHLQDWDELVPPGGD